MSPATDPAFVSALRAIPDGRSPSPSPAFDLSGTAPDGRPVSLELGTVGLGTVGLGTEHSGDSRALLLVAFLATNCDGCESFWRGLGDPGSLGLPAGVSPVVVTKGPGSVVAADVAVLAAGLSSVPVVMSDQAWVDYRVTGYPFFVLVDAHKRLVVGEAVGIGWSDVVAMVAAAS